MHTACLLLALLADADPMRGQLPPATAGAAATPAFVAAAAAATDKPRGWLNADYLAWWLKGAPLPPVVTTAPFNPGIFNASPLPPIPGALGSPGTTILYGDQTVGYGTFNGLRLHGGAALDAQGWLSLEGSGFLLERRARVFSAQSGADGTPLLGIPLVNALTGQEALFAVSSANDLVNTGGLAGGVKVVSNLRLWGGEANLALDLYRTPTFRATALAGFRYLDLSEDLGVTTQFTPIGFPLARGFVGNPLFLGQTDLTSDLLRTRNQFYGSQVGARFEWIRDRLCAGLTTKVAVGSTSQRLDIAGSTTLLTPGAPTQFTPGGALAQPSNIGTYRHSDFSVVPEVGIDLSWRLTPRTRVSVGYSFLYWSGVARPGDQVDRVVDPNQVPSLQALPGLTGTRPAARFERSDFWAHGVSVGVEVDF